MLNDHPYPWILQAWLWTRDNLTLRSDWHCYIKIACDARGIDWLGDGQLSDRTLNAICYHWLAEKGYHELKIISDVSK